MNRNNFWRFILVVLVLLWSIYELYPPRGSDLIEKFRDRAIASRADTNFTGIVDRALALQRKMPEKAYENLREAVGTNDIVRYFPFYGATNEPHPTTFILNRLQREASGKIKLGIDLQGGTSFLVRMTTNVQSGAEATTNAAAGTNTVSSVEDTNAPGASQFDTGAALSQAIEVLRKRVDKFDVAEPVIQQQGSDQILLTLPGLSAAEQESAELAIKKPAYLEFRLVHPDSNEDVRDNVVHPGYQVLSRKEKDQQGRET